MPGTYNGGGTLIGPGIPWPVESTYDPPSAIGSLTQAEVLKALGISKGMMKTKKRGDILKRLVAEGVLLNTGQPNPEHPKVIALMSNRAQG